MRLFLTQMNPIVGDFDGNTQKILDAIFKAKEADCNFVLAPEMAICGYPPDDFLLLHSFVKECETRLAAIISASSQMVVVVGLPRYHGQNAMKSLANSAAVIADGRLLGFQDKVLLPTYDVFDESRYFYSNQKTKVFEFGNDRFGVTVCEDIWQHSDLVKFTNYQFDPILEFKNEKLDFLVNLSASPFSRYKVEKRIAACSKAAKTLGCPVILCNQVGGNDSLIFDGYSLCVGADGALLANARGFCEDTLVFDLQNLGVSKVFVRDEIGDIYRALVLGLKDYLRKSDFSQVMLGLSGGIDSALVACIASEAVGRENVLAVSLPSQFTSKESIEDARCLAKTLGIEFFEIPIEKAFENLLTLLDPYFLSKPFDVTEENLQARIRGVLLMAISNKFGKIVLSCGNKSELAMGYATLYGDMCGGLGVISDVTKQEVYALARFVNREREVIPKSVLEKLPSAELKPNQKDSDTLPDYEIVDSVLKEYVENHLTPFEIAKKYHFPKELVEDLVRRIHANEYKRRQSAPGLRISEKAFSIGYRFPIVQKYCR